MRQFFRALFVTPAPKPVREMPPDLQAFEEARNELVNKIDAFGALVREMQAPPKKKTTPTKTPRKK